MSRCDAQDGFLLDAMLERRGQACCYRVKEVAVNQSWPKEAFVISHVHRRVDVAGHCTKCRGTLLGGNHLLQERNAVGDGAFVPESHTI